ncbi:hypothetical protein, partial [Bellilinea sp.]
RFLKEAAVSRKKDIDFSDQNGYHSAIVLSGYPPSKKTRIFVKKPPPSRQVLIHDMLRSKSD